MSQSHELPVSPVEVSSLGSGSKAVASPTKPAKKPGSLRFRHGSSARYDTVFSEDQPWVKTAGRICSEYVDEAAELAEIYTGVLESQGGRLRDGDERLQSPPLSEDRSAIELECSMSPSNSIPLWSPNQSLAKRRRTNEVSENGSQHSVASTHPNSFIQSVLPHRVDSPSQAINSPQDVHDAAVKTPLGNLEYHNTYGKHVLSPSIHNTSPINASIFSSPAFWPHANLQEACLMRYFIDNLACWFDLCDPSRHFALTIPARAHTCPALLNAVFTASARHLCRLDIYRNHLGQVEYLGKVLSDLRIETAIEYHSRCIEHLVSESHDPEAAFDENLLAASVILRFYDEVDAPISGGDLETGLRGAQVFIDAQVSLSVPSPGQSFESPAPPTSLRNACFRVAFRQEVYMAFIKQCTFRLPLSACSDYRSLEPTDDYTWAHRMVVHCADVLIFCYGEGDGGAGKSEYDDLIKYNTEWGNRRPRTFDPIWEQEPEVGRWYPDLWFLSDCHVTGVQHQQLAQILLTVYNPRIPRLGPLHKAAVQQISADIAIIVRRVCGVALSNGRAPPAMNTACMAIAMCGDQFDDPGERQAMLDLLRWTDEKHAWPTTEMQHRLKEAWGWST